MPQYLGAIYLPDDFDPSSADEAMVRDIDALNEEMEVPVLLGTGKRFFSDRTPPHEFALVSTKAASSGVIISTYRLSGPLRTGTVGE